MKERMGGLSVTLGVGLLAVSAAVATAQQPSSSTTTHTGQPSTSTSTRVVHATIVSVYGNKVVALDSVGKATEYTIPDGFRFESGGKDIGVADLKPGMNVTAKITTTTTTTPVFVTEIRTGKVLAVSGQSVIIRGPQGNRMFTNKDAEKRNVRVTRNGEQVLLSDLRTGDNVTAVIVTDELPKVVSEREVEAMIHAAPQPASAPASAPAPAPAAGTTAPAEAPAAAPAAAPAGAPAAAPAEAPTAAAPAPAAAPAADSPAPASGFPTWAIWAVLLIVVVVVVVLLRRGKS